MVAQEALLEHKLAVKCIIFFLEEQQLSLGLCRYYDRVLAQEALLEQKLAAKCIIFFKKRNCPWVCAGTMTEWWHKKRCWSRS